MAAYYLQKIYGGEGLLPTGTLGVEPAKALILGAGIVVGAVIIDVSVDQGGCLETSRPTTHDDPIYEVDGIIHYAVSNMPGAYPKTSTLALTNVTLPYIKILANKGIEKTIREDSVIRSSLNTYMGEIVHKALADSMGFIYKSVDEIRP